MNRQVKKIPQNPKLNNSSFKDIINFPNFVNSLTILIIVLIYIITLVILGSALFPKQNYIVRLNYPQGTYNSEINPYVFIRGTAIDTDSSADLVKLQTEYRVFAYINSNVSTNKPYNVRYAYSGIDKLGTSHYFYETSRKGLTLPISHYVVASALKVGNDEFDEFFIRLRYDVLENSTVTTKELKISEKTIDLNKRELKSSVFTNEKNLGEILTVNFKVQDLASVNQYETNIEVKINNFNVPYHLNLQSWIVNEDNEIFPYLGLYNYASKANFAPWYPTTVWKYAKPKAIYMILHYTDANNETTKMYYKANFSELLQN